jgi:excisionase family DNA binding protein
MDADAGRTLDDLLNDEAGASRVGRAAAIRLLSEVAQRQTRLAQLQALLLLAAAGAQSAEREEDRLLTMDEVAARLQVPVAHAREMGRRHELPTVHVGRYVRVRESSLRAWLKQREEALDAAPGRAYHPRPKRAERASAQVVPLRHSEGRR